MSLPQSEDLKKVLSILRTAKANVSDALVHGDHQMLKLGLIAALDQQINRFSFLAGLDPEQHTQHTFPPVTNFMGEEISAPKAISQDELSPAELEKAKYLDKVNRLYKQFDTIAPEGILNTYTIPEGQLVLRGVAKKAGVPDYDTRELTLLFVEDIAKAIKVKAEQEVEEKKLQDQLAKQQQIIDTEARIKEVNDKVTELTGDLSEAETDAAAAKSDKDKKKAADKITSISQEIAAAKELLAKTQEELDQLKA